MDDTSKLKEIIGERIRLFRVHKSLTQKKLAEITELNEKYLSRVERGSENITLETMIKITSALDISLEELFHGTQQSTKETNLLINEIISLLQTMTERDHKFFLSMINLLSNWKG